MKKIRNERGQFVMGHPALGSGSPKGYTGDECSVLAEGSRVPKLDRRQVWSIRYGILSMFSTNELMWLCGVSRPAINAVRRGDSWKFVTADYFNEDEDIGGVDIPLGMRRCQTLNQPSE